ncbi:hypothetical protein [Limosilactobacillus reuteri]|uniref:hypothetical protein n=1 Tax=Limosilactobacillus reuteri TaxID=1598 RepID=UPI00159F1C55|nr:hypothetical protein [Limosilactobacillus reuteri]
MVVGATKILANLFFLFVINKQKKKKKLFYNQKKIFGWKKFDKNKVADLFFLKKKEIKK